LGAYHLENVAVDEKSSNEFKDLKVQADEIDGQNAYLIYHGSSKEKDATYRLRFTEKGQDIFIDPDFVYFLQNTCRLVPAHPKDLDIESRTVKAYSIRPKSSSCIKTV
ncbi:MAG: hypothetical protein LUP94_03175, partial [Candidatus Methanomethylicus sp.]|nr:hypothetical protein [Candidatus Methanomethylicus sp.]